MSESLNVSMSEAGKNNKNMLRLCQLVQFGFCNVTQQLLTVVGVINT